MIKVDKYGLLCEYDGYYSVSAGKTSRICSQFIEAYLTVQVKI